MNYGKINLDGQIGTSIQSVSSSSGNLEIDWTNSNFAKIILTEDILNFTFIAPPNSCELYLLIEQDNPIRTINWPINLVWTGNYPLALPILEGYLMLIRIIYDGINFYANPVTTFWNQYTTENIEWENLVNMVAVGNDLDSTDVNARASGTVVLTGNGYVEATIGLSSIGTFFSLSDGVETSYANLNYAFYSGTAYATGIYENNVSKYASGNFVVGDKIKIERVNGNTIKYYKNGVLLYTSLTTTTSDLYCNVYFYTAGKELNDTKIAQ